MPKHRAAKPEIGTLAIRWLDEVADHDYAAAQAYLSLSLDDKRASKIVARLRTADTIRRRANDILRATGLTAAALDDPGVIKDLVKLIEGKGLSPVLLVRGDGRADIADGFHRVSMIYRIDPYAEIPLRLADAET